MRELESIEKGFTEGRCHFVDNRFWIGEVLKLGLGKANIKHPITHNRSRNEVWKFIFPVVLI